MFGWFTSPTPSTSATPAPAPTPAPPAIRSKPTFDQLVQEEIPIQTASVAMEGGMPSCLTLFDNFLLCYSLASQGTSVYRYGAPRDCTPKFEDFKFCMSIKSLPEERKDQVWIKRRAEWWAKRRQGKSSEDVWDARRDVYDDPAAEPSRAATA